MDERLSSRSHLDPSIPTPTHDPKLAGEKHTSTESGGKSDLSRKRIKMRDLHSIQDHGIGIHYSESSQSKEAKYPCKKNEETSQITKKPATMISDVFLAGSTAKNTLSLFTDSTCISLGHVNTLPLSIDLNTKAPILNTVLSDGMAADIDDSKKQPLFTKYNKDQGLNVDAQLDLNAKDVANSVEQDQFYPFKGLDPVKSAEASECGSSTGPLEEKDSFRVWKEMKENGFLSSSHGGIPIPKQRGRKSKNDLLKKKMELAKREQVNRFTKVAAPSGLLNGLNPGIINHVRNSKQVHSIIEALVRSEKLENGIKSRPPSQLKIGTEDRRKDLGISQLSHSHEGKAPTTSSEIRHTTEYPMSSYIDAIPLSSNHKGGHGDSNIANRRTSVATTGASLLTSQCENEKLALNISSPITMVSENISTLSNEESANQASVSSLSVKAATIASQWLELLCQDIKGRLAALRRSKKRVQAVIQIELPFLIAREFPANHENVPYSSQSSSTGCHGTATPDMHRARWTALFDQMDRTLSEEGRHLESWLNQVQEMQLRCERGLQCVNWYGMQLLGRPDDSSTKKERELAVRAAAASIYSTCNMVMATDDVSCI